MTNKRCVYEWIWESFDPEWRPCCSCWEEIPVHTGERKRSLGLCKKEQLLSLVLIFLGQSWLNCDFTLIGQAENGVKWKCKSDLMIWISTQSCSICYLPCSTDIFLPPTTDSNRGDSNEIDVSNKIKNKVT